MSDVTYIKYLEKRLYEWWIKLIIKNHLFSNSKKEYNVDELCLYTIKEHNIKEDINYAVKHICNKRVHNWKEQEFKYLKLGIYINIIT